MKISVFYENILEGVQFDSIDIKTVLQQLKQEGMDAVYCSYETLKNDSEDSILTMLQELDLGVEGLYGFISFEHNPLDEEYKKMIDMAVKVGGRNFLFVPGFILEEEQDKADELKVNMWAGLKKAVQYGKTCGIDISIEDFDGLTAPYCRLSGVQEFLENVPGMKFNFDTGNFIMYHDDELTAYEELKDKICNVHLKDRSHHKRCEKHPATICADGDKMYSVPIGDGEMQIKEIMTRLKMSGYDGGLVVELYGFYAEDMLKGIRKSVKWIKESWESI